MPNAFIGIDWGTHSSKWCFQDLSGNRVVGRIWDSRVYRIGDSLAIFPMQSHYHGGHGESALKRKLIQDPDQSFWEGPRRKLNVTLAEAVIFSLVALLRDVQTTLAKRNIRIREDREIEVRFSHPNWLHAEAVPALQYFRDAALVALNCFLKEEKLPDPEDSFQMDVSQLRGAVQVHRDSAAKLENLPEILVAAPTASLLKGSTEGVGWQLIFESCAAGLPYLVEAELELFDGGRVRPLQHHQVRKLLVVDIGAGSTDAGYMLRTIPPDPRTGAPLGPALIWFPPAPAFERAGNWLTDRICDKWRAEGRKATPEEAEDFKTSGATEWQGELFVHDWCESIAERLHSYLLVLSEDTFLTSPRQGPLEIVLTGGSSVIGSLRPSVMRGVKSALSSRGVHADLGGATRFLDSRAQTEGGQDGYAVGNAPQLAVCIGASHPHLAELRCRA
jgi:hypothetical protein